MKKNLLKDCSISLILFLTVLGVWLSSSASIFASTGTVTSLSQGISSDTVVQALLGAGVTVSNVKYKGTDIQGGIIEGSILKDMFDFNKGIILSTGNVKDFFGKNDMDYPISSPAGGGGDDDLNHIVNADIHDSSVLEFDFVPTKNKLFFEYVFASEEYPIYVGSQYNDAFGFFLDGQNIALIPGTEMPVSINNVNAGHDITPASNPAFFIPNYPPNNQTYSGKYMDNCTMNGLTKVLDVNLNVVPNKKYHIKFAIGDVGDSALDSCVVIRGGSFSTEPPNIPPVAVAGSKQDSETSDKKAIVTLDGSKSYDKNKGDKLTYLWTCKDIGPTWSASGVTTQVTLKSGLYVFTLTVSDGKATDSDTITMSISFINSPPVAIAGDDQTITFGNKVILDGSKSFDPDKDPLTYKWTGNGINSTDVKPGLTLLPVGVYIITLEVSDGNASSKSQVTITVVAANHPPVANAGSDQTVKVDLSVSPTTKVTLDGSKSSDPDPNDTLTYKWTGGLGTVLGKKPQIPLPVGEHTIKLEVSDGNLSSTDTVIIKVTSVNHAPKANAGPDQTVSSTAKVTLDGSQSHDPDPSDLLKYTWSGSFGTVIGVSPQLSPLAPGNYDITLTVSDGTLSDTDTVKIKVMAPMQAPIISNLHCSGPILSPLTFKAQLPKYTTKYTIYIKNFLTNEISMIKTVPLSQPVSVNMLDQNLTLSKTSDYSYFTSGQWTLTENWSIYKNFYLMITATSELSYCNASMDSNSLFILSADVN